MSVPLTDNARALLDGKNFATVATQGPGGAPHASVVWVKRDGDAIEFSTLATRQKARNIERDPRVSVALFDLANPYVSVEIRGTAELIPDEAKKLPHELSHKYLGIDPPGESDDERRLIVRVTPRKVIEFVPASSRQDDEA
ncbi:MULTISPECIES: PPOX class F420-dependent oxidoreductase [unclassified Streptomyces]|uniref:PPOX class F420-dependent oxidoreductase n=1 Tax=unclassified Streptomyces TaxID=2593676 RepID=UPI0038196939